MKLSSFRRDSESETSGVWEDYGGGLTLLIARMGNPNYVNYLARLQREQAKNRQRVGIEGEETEKLVMKAIAKHVLLSWRGLEDDDGQQIEPTEENRLKVLSENQNFYNEVAVMSSNAAIFADKARKEALGN